MNWTPNRRMALIALAVYALDQVTKFIVLQLIGPHEEKVVIDGFFKFVNWSNTGAAWSLFHNRNSMLAIVSILALVGLFFWRHHFDTKTIPGQVSLGLIFGGILGNLTDRLIPHSDQFGNTIYGVIDFLRFYLYRRSGEEIGFPAFNVADSAICVGVGLLIILSWKQETEPKPEQPPHEQKSEA